MMIITAIFVAPYFTDKAEHTALYNIHYNNALQDPQQQRFTRSTTTTVFT